MRTVFNLGFWLDLHDTVEEPDIAHPHQFCGSSSVQLPQCPNCNGIFLHIATIDTRDEFLKSQMDLPIRLPLLYCWHCPIADGVLAYRVLHDQVELVNWVSGSPNDDYVEADTPRIYRGGFVKLIAIGLTQQATIEGLNSGTLHFIDLPLDDQVLAQPTHQLGGEPLLLQFDDAVSQTCPLCGKDLYLIGTIGSECLNGGRFIDDTWVQIVYWWCPNCQCVSCRNFAD